MLAVLVLPITNTTNKRFVLILFLSFFFSPSFFLLAQVYQSNLIHYPNITHTHGLVTTIVGLQVVLDGSHFKNGSMRVKCLASVSPVLSMSSSTSSSASGTDGVNGGINNGRISYVQRRPLLDNREAMLLGMCSMFIACKIYWPLKMVTATSCLSIFFSSSSFSLLWATRSSLDYFLFVTPSIRYSTLFGDLFFFNNWTLKR